MNKKASNVLFNIFIWSSSCQGQINKRTYVQWPCKERYHARSFFPALLIGRVANASLHAASIHWWAMVTLRCPPICVFSHLMHFFGNYCIITQSSFSGGYVLIAWQLYTYIHYICKEYYKKNPIEVMHHDTFSCISIRWWVSTRNVLDQIKMLHKIYLAS